VNLPTLTLTERKKEREASHKARTREARTRELLRHILLLGYFGRLLAGGAPDPSSPLRDST